MHTVDTELLQGLIGRRDPNKDRWDERTRGAAPHKPLLILAICDLFESCRVVSPLIPSEGAPLITLADHYSSYWNRIIRDRRGDMMMPFWALTTNGFWNAVAQPGVVITGDRPKSFLSFSKHYIGVELHPQVHALMVVDGKRQDLREWIIGEFFDVPTQAVIAGLVRYNTESDAYSLRLLAAAEEGSKALESIERYSTAHGIERPVRDQGFRIAVREAYAYRCAACGVRIQTPDGHAMVQGAHIRPHAETADDRIVNGMALCHSCHWAFDEGLWTIAPTLDIRTSPVLRWGDNLPGYLESLESQPLRVPAEANLQPDPESLRWHREDRFRAS